MDEKRLRYMSTYQFPRIMRPFEEKSPSHISSLVLNDQLFGFVECDLRSPDWLIEKYRHINFPVLIRRENVTLEMMGSYMRERLATLGRKVPAEGLESIVNAWHGTKLLLFTPLLKWYLSMGLEMTAVHDVIQYQPSKCFQDFIQSCVNGRIRATKEKNDLQAQSFKICMNSS